MTLVAVIVAVVVYVYDDVGFVVLIDFIVVVVVIYL